VCFVCFVCSVWLAWDSWQGMREGLVSGVLVLSLLTHTNTHAGPGRGSASPLAPGCSGDGLPTALCQIGQRPQSIPFTVKCIHGQVHSVTFTVTWRAVWVGHGIYAGACANSDGRLNL
jgi:hypothetical protein